MISKRAVHKRNDGDFRAGLTIPIYVDGGAALGGVVGYLFASVHD